MGKNFICEICVSRMKICDIVSTSFGLKCNVYGQMVKNDPQTLIFPSRSGQYCELEEFWS